MPPSEEEERSQKAVAFYSAVVAAWIETKMERDRSIVGLSSGGVGLVVTLFAAATPPAPWLLIPYALACLGFVVAIVACLLTFDRNADHLLEVAKEGEGKANLLRWHNRISAGAFGVAILALFVIGFGSAYYKLCSTGYPT